MGGRESPVELRVIQPSTREGCAGAKRLTLSARVRGHRRARVLRRRYRGRHPRHRGRPRGARGMAASAAGIGDWDSIRRDPAASDRQVGTRGVCGLGRILRPADEGGQPRDVGSLELPLRCQAAPVRRASGRKTQRDLCSRGRDTVSSAPVSRLARNEGRGSTTVDSRTFAFARRRHVERPTALAHPTGCVVGLPTPLRRQRGCAHGSCRPFDPPTHRTPTAEAELGRHRAGSVARRRERALRDRRQSANLRVSRAGERRRRATCGDLDPPPARTRDRGDSLEGGCGLSKLRDLTQGWRKSCRLAVEGAQRDDQLRFLTQRPGAGPRDGTTRREKGPEGCPGDRAPHRCCERCTRGQGRA